MPPKAASKKAPSKKATSKKVAVPHEITIKGRPAKKGDRMTPGAGWRLAATKGTQRVFKGTLIDTVNWGTQRFAIFSVPK